MLKFYHYFYVKQHYIIINSIIKMNKSESSSSSIEAKPHKNKYEFNLDKNKKIIIDSQFDNGNISLIKQISQLYYRLQAVSDTKTSSCRKTWFHFRVKAPKYVRIKLMIENVKIYESMYEDKNWMKPVVRQEAQWKQLKDSYLLYRDQIAVVFQYIFNTDSFVYFALTTPFTYTDSENYLQDIFFKIPENIYYKDQIIAKSLNNLNTHLLTITHKNKEVLQRKKPIILITARVHPGEVSSSYCLIGMLDFILKPQNAQSYILRNMFTFLVIPMVNPDGVYEGNFRMDINGVNLNRVYNDPSEQLHPTVFHIKKIINKEMSGSKIFAHFDLHSHSSIKNAFIYGNAFDDIVTQTQTELFCKLLEQNCQIFKYPLSQFGEKHMKMKDRGQNLSKEGCARVVISRLANVTYSYTVQTSIFSYIKSQGSLQLSPKSEGWEMNEMIYEEISSRHLIQRKPINMLVADNMVLGSQLLISLLDILQKNPFSRFSTENFQIFRKQICQQIFQTEERFKLLDLKAYQKTKAVVRLSKQQFTDKYNKVWSFLAVDSYFLKVSWPKGFKWFEKQVQKRKVERTRYKTDNSQNSLRQINDIIAPKNPRRYFYEQSELSAHKNQIIFSSHEIMPKQREDKNILEVLSKKYLDKQQLVQKKENQNDKHELLKKVQTETFYEQNQLKEIRKLKEKESTTIKQNIILDIIEDEMQKMISEKKSSSKPLPNHNSKALSIRKEKKSRSSKLFDGNYKIELRQKKITQVCADLLSNRQDFDNSEFKAKRQSMKSNHKKELTKIKFAQIKKKNLSKPQFKLPELRSGVNFMVYNREKATTLPDQY